MFTQLIPRDVIVHRLRPGLRTTAGQPIQQFIDDLQTALEQRQE